MPKNGICFLYMAENTNKKASETNASEAMAESQGFEPWVVLPTQHFECCTFDHSDNSP